MIIRQGEELDVRALRFNKSTKQFHQHMQSRKNTVHSFAENSLLCTMIKVDKLLKLLLKKRCCLTYAL